MEIEELQLQPLIVADIDENGDIVIPVHPFNPHMIEVIYYEDDE